MTAEPAEPEMDIRTSDETQRLFDHLRTANLNVRYYGALAQKRKLQNTKFQICIAVLSLLALVVFATEEFRHAAGIYGAAASGAATILAGALPFLGWDEDGKTYTFLNRSYLILENQIREVLSLLRRDGLTDELLGRSKQLIDSMTRLQGFDEEDHSKTNASEKNKLYEEVNEAYPPGYELTL